MELVSLIGEDIKRLGNLTSLESDLDDLFLRHMQTYALYGALPQDIAHTKDYAIHKVRMAISTPIKSTSNGVRLWIYVNKPRDLYVQCLLYAANEEKSYKSSTCFKIVYDRLDNYAKGLK